MVTIRIFRFEDFDPACQCFSVSVITRRSGPTSLEVTPPLVWVMPFEDSLKKLMPAHVNIQKDSTYDDLKKYTA